MTPYLIFWKYLEFALTIAEIAHPGSNKAMGAIRRLILLEEGPEGTPGVPAGTTGYLNNNDPYQALNDYVAHIYTGAPEPYWLTSAERG